MAAVLVVLGWLPRPLREAVGRGVGWLAWMLGIRRRVTLENLAAAYPDLDASRRGRIARAAYRNMSRAVVEALVSTRVRDEELAESVESEEVAVMDRALSAGKGLLVATAHFGNWELLGAVLARRGVRLNVVVRPLRGALNAHLVAARVRSGMGFIPPRGAISGTLAALRRNEVVAMLIDQAIGGKHSLYVPFFGRRAATTPAFSLAALRTDAPVLVGLAAREADRLRLHFDGPFPLEQTGDRTADLWAHTARVTAALERGIRRFPDQWLWLHRRWKLSPPPDQRLRLELLALAAHADALEQELDDAGATSEVRSRRLDALHRANATRLEALVTAYGWPAADRVGPEAERAAVRIRESAV